MARPLRIEFSGALYHVTARGYRREPIYENDGDREAFLQVLGEVVELPDPNLSKGMRQLNGLFTQTLNRRQYRSGHLFQGRLKTIFVLQE